ncbi:MAG: hypothetical protein WAL56_24460, partial [Candidatus Sulfotelmatobacter sp.]
MESWDRTGGALHARYDLSGRDCALSVPAALAQGPTVYISGEGGSYATAHSAATHNETMEMARTLLKSCPEISLTVAKEGSTEKVDYIMLLNRQEEHSFGSAISQLMVLRPDQSVMFAGKQGTVARATKEGCKAIMADWKDHRPRTAQ